MSFLFYSNANVDVRTILICCGLCVIRTPTSLSSASALCLQHLSAMSQRNGCPRYARPVSRRPSFLSAPSRTFVLMWRFVIPLSVTGCHSSHAHTQTVCRVFLMHRGSNITGYLCLGLCLEGAHLFVRDSGYYPSRNFFKLHIHRRFWCVQK